MNFESPYPLPEDSREPEGFPNLERALIKAEKYVYAYAIDPMDFSSPNGPYEQSSIERDLERIKQAEQGMVERNWTEDRSGSHARQEALRKVAHVFEAMVLDNIDSNEWLGSHARIIVPSRYDDVVNGVDGIVEFEDEKRRFSHLALAMDMTSSADVEKKVSRILDEIDHGKLTMIRYFESEAMHIRGEKRNVPRVVIGADRQTIHDLMDPWVDGKNSSLRNCAFQIQTIDEIMLQLTAFRSYAEQKGQTHLVEIFDRDLAAMADVLAEKQDAYSKNGIAQMRRENAKDAVFQSLQRTIATIGSKKV